jgi:hypothetical protein
MYANPFDYYDYPLSTYLALFPRPPVLVPILTLTLTTLRFLFPSVFVSL